MTSNRGNEFALIAYQVLVVEKRTSIKQLAPKMALSYDTLYARIHGRVPFSANEIMTLISEVPDLRLINYFLENTPYLPVKRNDDEAEENESVHRSATRTVIEASDVLREVERGLKDQIIDHRDKARIKDEIDAAERALAGLREMLD